MPDKDGIELERGKTDLLRAANTGENRRNIAARDGVITVGIERIEADGCSVRWRTGVVQFAAPNPDRRVPLVESWTDSTPRVLDELPDEMAMMSRRKSGSPPVTRKCLKPRATATSMMARISS